MHNRSGFPTLILILVLILAFGLSPTGLAQAQEIREVGTDLQLFIDDWLVESMQQTRRVLHRPQAKEIAIEVDRPWEGSYLYDPSILKDGNRYRMWYRGGGTERPHLWGYAESTDGIHWVKPELGLIEYRGSTKNNLVWPVPGVSCSTLSVFIDGNPALQEHRDGQGSERHKRPAGHLWPGLTRRFALAPGPGEALDTSPGGRSRSGLTQPLPLG